jgi:hypothetical protein
MVVDLVVEVGVGSMVMVRRVRVGGLVVEGNDKL